jgi:hypothetical protein
VIDEASSLLREPAVAGYLAGSWKLARSLALAHIVVVHRVADVDATGDSGSAHRAGVLGLLRDCDLSFVLRQSDSDVDAFAAVSALHPRERAVVVGARRGEALVRYGRFRSFIRINPSAQEWALVDTDAAMRGWSS